MTGRGLLAIGECMVELAPAGDGLYAMGFAGDTFNTAWYARRLLPADWSVGYASAVGTDEMSDDMLAFLAAQGIDTGAVRRIQGRSVGLYLIRLRDGERSFAYWRGQSAARALADDADALRRDLAGWGVLYLSGITLAILPPAGRAALCAALAEARAAGARVALDTNLRPGLWESAEAMRAGLMQGAAVADTVLPSFDEEVQAFGDAAPEDTIARYRAAGATEIVVKNGAAPCHVWSREGGTARIDPVPVDRVTDTTAAGDSFSAGYVTARALGAAPPDAARRAAALAARVVQRRGALAPDIFETEGAP